MAEKLSQQAVAAALKNMPKWNMASKRDAIERHLVFDDFAAAWAFMTRIALKAEQINHHPEWSNVWNRVSITLATHDAGGITELDFTLARAIDEAAGN